MISKSDIEATGFHEAEISSMRMENECIFIKFSSFSINMDDDFYQADVRFNGVSNTTCDDKLINGLHVEGDGSSVIQLERSNNFAKLIVDWRYYKERKSKTRVYSFNFKDYDLQFRRQQVTA